MKRLYCVLTVFLAVSLAWACAQEAHDMPKNVIKTFSVLGDSYSTFEGYIPEGNAWWYSSSPQGPNDVVKVEDTWWHRPFCRESLH